MLKFGIIAEGPTDQTVIENILLGYFDDQDEEPAINFVQPPRPLAETPGGWGNVFKSLGQRRHEEALQLNDYLVIHIDTDVQDEYGVPRREAGKELSVTELVDRVIAKLKQFIDPTYYQDNATRILFAISVDSIECWLLPLLYKEKKKAAKTTGCFDAANKAIRKLKQILLSASGHMGIRAYENASKDYRKRKTLMANQGRNPSLELFIKQLDAVRETLTANQGQLPTNTAGDQTVEANE